jgi:hypothetical protein
MITDDQLAEWSEIDLRVAELADRMTAPGPKASTVSASELHEVAEFVSDVARGAMPALIAEVWQSRALRAGVEQILRNTADVHEDDVLHVLRDMRKALSFLLEHSDAPQ